MHRTRLPLLILALAVAGCGSSGPSSPATTASQATTTVATTETETETATSSSTTADAPASVVPRCHTAQLSAQATFGSGAGSAGHLTGALVLQNTSSTPCSLHGYPGVSWVAAAGRQVGAPAIRSAGPVVTIVLRAGKSAAAELELTDPGALPSCGPTPARGFRVYPPDERDALYAPHAGTACTSDSATLRIGPFAPR